MTRVLAIASVLAFIGAPATAQLVPNRDSTVQTTNRDTRAITVPVGTTASIPLTVDTANGGDLLDVVSSDPAVTISLMLPNGVEVNAGNAEAQGFSFTDAVVIASYFSALKVRAGIITDAPLYHLGDTVILSSLVFDDTTPMTSASMIVRIGVATDSVTPPAEVVLQDSGTHDDRTGDGIYTGEYTATAVGTFYRRLEGDRLDECLGAVFADRRDRHFASCRPWPHSSTSRTPAPTMTSTASSIASS